MLYDPLKFLKTYLLSPVVPIIGNGGCAVAGDKRSHPGTFLFILLTSQSPKIETSTSFSSVSVSAHRPHPTPHIHKPPPLAPIAMQCILLGITPPSTSDSIDADDETTALELLDHLRGRVGTVDGSEVNWVAESRSLDADTGKLVQLFCATTGAPVESVVKATSVAASEANEVGSKQQKVSDDNQSCECELWASAPAILPLRPFDGYDKYITHNNQYDKKSSNGSCEGWSVSTMKEWGMFIQTSLIKSHEVEELKQCIHEEIASIEQLINLHRPDINIGKDIISFAEISSRGNERFDLLVRPSSKAYDFVEHVILDRICSTLEEILGGSPKNKDVDYDISVVYSKPGAPHQGWHADGDHQRGATDAGWDVNGWKTQLADPYALCLFIPLIDLDETTGYTQFWPASHRSKGLMGFGPVAEITEATWNGKCKAGDAIWYDYRLMHRGMGNTSQDVVRPVLQVLFKKKWYVEKRNYGTESLREM